MEEKVCCFIGHRKIEKNLSLENKILNIIEDFIVNKNVKYFLLGSKSEFIIFVTHFYAVLNKNILILQLLPMTLKTNIRFWNVKEKNMKKFYIVKILFLLTKFINAKYINFMVVPLI